MSSCPPVGRAERSSLPLRASSGCLPQRLLSKALHTATASAPLALKLRYGPMLAEQLQSPNQCFIVS
eukprot:187751-Alexandrium_andersonii.AAC.1